MWRAGRDRAMLKDAEKQCDVLLEGARCASYFRVLSSQDSGGMVG